jgi:hypothetical protein
VAAALAALGRMPQAVDMMQDVIDGSAERQHIPEIPGEPLIGVAALASIAGLGEQSAMLLALARQTRQHVRSPWQYAFFRYYTEQSAGLISDPTPRFAADPIEIARHVLDDVRAAG